MLPGMATPMLIGGGPAYPSTWNPADLAQVTLSASNRTMQANAATYGSARAILPLGGSLLRFSARIGVTVANPPLLGIANSTASLTGTNYIGIDTNGISYQCTSGSVLRSNGVLATYSGAVVGDVITIDITGGNFSVSKNGTLLGTVTGHSISGTIYPAATGAFGTPAATLTLL